MDKYITTEQIKTIIDNAPKGVDKASLVDKIASRGYVIQGFNDQEYQKQKAQGSFGQRVASDISGRIQDVKKPIMESMQTFADPNIPVSQRIVGGLAEAGKVPLRTAGAIVGAGADIIGEGINQLTGDTQLKTLEQQRAENPIYQKTVGLFGEEGAKTAGDITNVLGGEILGAAVKPLAKQVSKIRLPEIKTPNLKSSVGSYVEDKVKQETSDLLGITKSVSKKAAEAQQRGIPLNEIIADPTVFRGIKVEGSKINPTEAVQTLDERIDSLVSAKRALLPEFDRLVAPQSKEIIRQRAYDDIAGKFSPADEKSIKQSIDKQIDALPDQLKITDMDNLRAQFRNSARDAKGMQKSSSEYSALENATRNAVFDLTDDLPIENAADYKALNDSIKQWIGAKDFLETTLNGQTVKGGRLQNLFARGIGAIAGAQSGPLAAILGSEAGGAISNVIVNNQLGSSIKMKLIRELTDDPEIIKKAEQLVEQAKTTNLLMLPSPSGKVGATGKEVIEALPSRSGRSIGFPDQN